MTKKLPDFTDEQWHFLAVFEAFGTSIPIDLVGHLAPLMPGPLFEVINRAKEFKWLEQNSENQFTISDNLPASLKKRFKKINTPDHLSEIVRRLENLELEVQIDPLAILGLMEKAGLGIKAIEMKIELADKLIKTDRQDQAWDHFRHAVECLADVLETDEYKLIFISTVLKLSKLSFILGKGLDELLNYLHNAQQSAIEIGDRRSHAIISMHLGGVYYFSDRRPDAMVAISVGLNEIEELGDADILEQSAVFLGLFYFLQGLFKDALPHLERAVRLYEIQVKAQLSTPISLYLLGFCLTYLGEFHRAIGNLDSHWRMAKDRGDHAVATTLRVILSTVLLLINRKKEADFHLKQAMKEAEESNNVFALFLVQSPLIIKFMASGQASKAYERIGRTVKESAASGIVRQYSSPWIMEIMSKLEEFGFDLIPRVSFKELKEKAVRENNIHLQGVALRIVAQKKTAKNKPIDSILNDLDKSKVYLEQSGDIVQLSKTLIEKARLLISGGSNEEGVLLIKKAWAVLGGYADDFFPGDLRYLLDTEQHDKGAPESPKESFDRYIELTETMFHLHSQDEILSGAVVATNRFFDAERGGLFWFPGGKMTGNPELRASCNLTNSDINSAKFKSNQSLIIKAFKENEPVVSREILGSSDHSGKSVKAILCLPLEIRGKIRAVLYHDNSYLKDCFDFLDDAMFVKIMGQISRQVDRIWEYFQIREERNDLISEKSLNKHSSGETNFIYKSRIMTDLIDQLDKASRSDSTILILGETGVGKELVARRVHEMSPRKENTFIIVDATTIPEGLIESELFGHEKGAFTGADRQKKGRLELANKGTLFIDEIGEMPKSIQVKLLRAIQERSFFRLGGTRVHSSDFRLIAATNRNLEVEVAEGRFREDLYYRLNVVPFHVPALRDRLEDVTLIAEHFLKRFAKKYHRLDLGIDPNVNEFLKQYDWPGNVRELENIMERAVLLSSEKTLEIDLPLNKLKKGNDLFDDLPSLDEMQKNYILYVLKKTNGKISGPGGACEILKIERTTLYTRMKKFGLR